MAFESGGMKETTPAVERSGLGLSWQGRSENTPSGFTAAPRLTSLYSRQIYDPQGKLYIYFPARKVERKQSISFRTLCCTGDEVYPSSFGRDQECEAYFKKQENQERWWNIWPLRKYWFRTESARIIIWWEKFIRIQSFFHYTMTSEKSYSRDHINVMCRKVWTELNAFLHEQIHSREIPYKCVPCGRVLEKDRLSKDISDLTQEKNPTNA